MSEKMSRYWVNAPSPSQPAHEFHASRVIGPRNLRAHVSTATVYFAGGSTVSAVLPIAALSPGWPGDPREK